MAWTDEMIETLKELWDQGVSTGEIGKKLGVTKNSVVGKVHRLKLVGRPSPIKRKDGTPIVKSSKNEVVEAKKAKEVKEAKKANAEKANAEKAAAKKEAKPVEAKETVKVKEVVKPVEAPKVLPKAEEKPKLEPTKTKRIEHIEEDIRLEPIKKEKEVYVYKEGGYALTELSSSSCRWPIGDPKDENFHFCGKKTKVGQTYCDEHASIAYVKIVKK